MMLNGENTMLVGVIMSERERKGLEFWTDSCVVYEALRKQLRDMVEPGEKPFPFTDAWWVCDRCLREWSAMCGDKEVPETCECGGRVVENS